MSLKQGPVHFNLVVKQFWEADKQCGLEAVEQVKHRQGTLFTSFTKNSILFNKSCKHQPIFTSLWVIFKNYTASLSKWFYENLN